MYVSGLLALLTVVCTWMVYDVDAAVVGMQFPRAGLPQAPGFRGSFPAFRGDDSKKNKEARNFLWPLPGRNGNPFARAGLASDRRASQFDDGPASAGGVGFGKTNRRYRRDYGGSDSRGFYPGAPFYGSGFGFGRPGGDFGQDFGYQSDGWRSK